MTVSDSRRVLNWLGLLLLIVIVVPFVIYAVPGAIGAEGSYVVLSGSMEPSISTGDVVVVDGVDPADIEEQDVITYLRSGSDTPTTHRVVDINEDGGELSFVTQGDANEEPDASPVAASAVRGKVVFTIPHIGYVIEFVNTPTGFVALVVVPFVLLLLSEMYSMVAGGSGSDDEGSGEAPEEPAGPGSAPAGSASEAGAFETTEITAADPADAGTDQAVRRPVRGPTAAETNGRRTASETAAVGEESEGGIALTRTDLRLSLGVLTGTAVYAGWVVYNIQAAWSFTVAFGSVIGAILVGTMYYAAGSDDASEPETTSDGGSGSAPSSSSSPEAVTGATSEVRTDGASMPSTEDAGTECADQAGSEEGDA